jgi:glycerol-3-phosphate dehydrogenase
MAATPLDVLIVGGGIAGAASAREAALRGLRVGLVEARDFGAGTSGATTRLAHGGLRYLEQGDLAQVREGLRERAWLLRAAPHLVRPLPFLLPIQAGRLGLEVQLRAGLALYDGLAPAGLPHHRFVRGDEARRLEPRLRSDAARLAASFQDAQILHPERLVLEFALAAARAGAAVANHAGVEGLARDAEGWRASVRDARTDRAVDVRARVVLNCAGPWVSQLAGLAGVRRPLARTTRGTHVAFPNFLQQALVLRARDGRTFFAIPWNEVALVGTTDLDDAGDPASVAATAEEVRYLLDEAGDFLDLEGLAPCYTTAGVRAMLRVEGVAPGAVPRSHAILPHDADGCPGLLSVIGGKLTTARAVAQDAVDAACKALGRARPRAPDTPLPGAGAEVAGALSDLPLGEVLQVGLGLLGDRALAAAVEGPVLCERHATRGWVRLAVREEWCSTLPDMMLRRTLAGHAPDLGAHCAEDLAKAMGELLGWDPAERSAQMEAWAREAERRRAGLASDGGEAKPKVI